MFILVEGIAYKEQKKKTPNKQKTQNQQQKKILPVVSAQILKWIKI